MLEAAVWYESHKEEQRLYDSIDGGIQSKLINELHFVIIQLFSYFLSIHAKRGQYPAELVKKFRLHFHEAKLSIVNNLLHAQQQPKANLRLKMKPTPPYLQDDPDFSGIFYFKNGIIGIVIKTYSRQFADNLYKIAELHMYETNNA